jgi:hypothetical protein
MAPPPAPGTPEGDKLVPFEFSAPGGATVVTTDRGRIVTFRGPVRATYGDYVITSETAVYREETESVEFTGKVTLQAPERTVTGESLRLDLRTREWTLTRGRTELTPESLQRGVLSSIYVRSAQLSGAPGIMELGEGAATTCDLEEPHYELRARSIEIYPGERLVARGASLYVLGRRFLPLATLVIPLRQRFGRLGPLPDVGYSKIEGFFVKYARPYRNRGNDGLLHLDYLSERGIGTGIDQAYRLFGGAGSLLLYNLFPLAGVPREASGRLQHRQQWGNLSGTFDVDYRESAYRYSVSPDTTTTSVNTNVGLLRQVTSGTTSLNLHYDRATSSTSFSNMTTSLAHTQRFSPTLAGDFGLEFLMSRFTGGQDTGQLNSRMELRRRAGALDVTLAANDTLPLGDTSGSVVGLERLPELILAMDTFRFRQGRYAQTLPARLSLSLGRFVEGLGGPGLRSADEARAQVDFNVQNKEWPMGDSTFRLTAGFRQSVYDGGGAHYVISGSPSLDWALGRESSLIFNYFYQNPAGFTPFRFDFPYRYNRIESTLALRKGDRFGFGVRTGYDFLADRRFRWQNITVHGRFMPTPTSLLTMATSYNPNPIDLPPGSRFRQQRLQTVIGELRIRIPDGIRLNLGARYDPARGGFPAAKGQIETALGRHWRVTALVGYDGFSRFADFMLVRDLHCWEVTFIRVDHRDWRREQSWRLMIRLKALPQYDRLGLGESGQIIDTSVGDVF